MFLDEPTSGLDASSATLVMSSLSFLSKNENVTIVAVIHQPRAAIFELFDGVILLSLGGKMVYHGPVSECTSYFVGLGYELPQGENVADWLIDISSGRSLPTNPSTLNADYPEISSLSMTSSRRAYVSLGVSRSIRSIKYEAGIARSDLASGWKFYMKNLDQEGQNRYACPTPYNLPRSVVKPSFVKQLLINIRRNVLITYRNMGTRSKDTLLILFVVVFISALFGPLDLDIVRSSTAEFSTIEIKEDYTALLGEFPFLFRYASRYFPILTQ